jgi:hypothetical protein
MASLPQSAYRAILSSDWNECLAPCGPFDCIAFAFPELADALAAVFKQYTGNALSLGEAMARVARLLPEPITATRMDAYLDQNFTTYKGVAELIEWCRDRDILFMINTTGMIGYFQRVWAKGLMPPVPALSANPLLRYRPRRKEPACLYELGDIQDKALNTRAAMRRFGIPADKVILLGDSGGDGPHFEWGAGVQALLVGSMTKPTLSEFCRQRAIAIDVFFGVQYAPGRRRSLAEEMQFDFMDLSERIEAFVRASASAVGTRP